MDGLSAEVSEKIRAAIRAKLVRNNLSIFLFTDFLQISFKIFRKNLARMWTTNCRITSWSWWRTRKPKNKWRTTCPCFSMGMPTFSQLGSEIFSTNWSQLQSQRKVCFSRSFCKSKIFGGECHLIRRPHQRWFLWIRFDEISITFQELKKELAKLKKQPKPRTRRRKWTRRKRKRRRLTRQKNQSLRKQSRSQSQSLQDHQQAELL